MRVSPSQPFQIIYSLFQHEDLGYLFESFVVQLDEKGRLTFQHQNISSLNAEEFEQGLDENDYELIRLMDNIHQDAVEWRDLAVVENLKRRRWCHGCDHVIPGTPKNKLHERFNHYRITINSKNAHNFPFSRLPGMAGRPLPDARVMSDQIGENLSLVVFNHAQIRPKRDVAALWRPRSPVAVSRSLSYAL